MKTYYHKHARGFANECDIVRCDDPDHATILEDAGYERLTRAELREHVSWVNGENDAWGSNRAFGAIEFAAIVDASHPRYGEYGSALAV